MQQSGLMYPHDFSYIVASSPVADLFAPPPVSDQLCSNAECRKPARRQRIGAFSGAPVCGPECLEAALRAALAREHALSTAAALETGPRIRIGQILVEQGVITEAQLDRALRSQRLTGAGRLGTWLRQQTQLPEEDFAAALSIQWRCPVFRIGAFAPDRMTGFLPRQLVEALGALPMRLSRDPERLTICFEDRVDSELLRGCERMHGIPVEAGLLASNEFWHGTADLLKAGFPDSCLVTATSLDEMIAAMIETLVRAEVINAHLVYVRGYYWLRLWVPGGAESMVAHDILCTLSLSAETATEGQLSEEMLRGLKKKRVTA
jgi:hypothetical protein